MRGVKKDVIREQDPLKQGLKLITWPGKKPEIAIREQDPLKQGLKLNSAIILAVHYS